MTVTDNITELRIEKEIDARGGITFPAIVRQATGLQKGERAIVELKDGKITIYHKDRTETAADERQGTSQENVSIT